MTGTSIRDQLIAFAASCRAAAASSLPVPIRPEAFHDLRGANLRGANLCYADLRGADLRGANLRGANLYYADLREADLRGADLRGANLRRANLYYADLREADLVGANFRRADLRGVNIRVADHGGAIGVVPIQLVPGLARKVLEQIELHPETHDQSRWHSDCGTKHCAAGWTCVLAGAEGKRLEQRFGTRRAAALLLEKAHGPLPAYLPFGIGDDPRPWLAALAAPVMGRWQGDGA